MPKYSAALANRLNTKIGVISLKMTVFPLCIAGTFSAQMSNMNAILYMKDLIRRVMNSSK